MPTSTNHLRDAAQRLLSRKKTKTKERSSDNKTLIKTKKVEIPLEGGVTKTLTKTITRPTAFGDMFGSAQGMVSGKEVKRNVSYSNNAAKTAPAVTQDEELTDEQKKEQDKKQQAVDTMNMRKKALQKTGKYDK